MYCQEVLYSSFFFFSPIPRQRRGTGLFSFLNLYKKGVEPITLKSIAITFKSTQILIKNRARAEKEDKFSGMLSLTGC